MGLNNCVKIYRSIIPGYLQGIVAFDKIAFGCDRLVAD